MRWQFLKSIHEKVRDHRIVAIAAGAFAGLGAAYAFYPAESADFLRDRFGYDAIFEVEQIVFGVQDRLNQTLDSVTQDIGRYVEWLHGAEDQTADRPQDWLARLA